jgi:hypothetical protein
MYVVNSYFNHSILSLITDQSTLTEVSIFITGGTFEIDWGDGSDPEETVSNSYLSHNYSEEDYYEIKIYDNKGYSALDITSFYCSYSNLMGEVNFSKLTNLKYLTLRGNWLTNFILGDNTEIYSLDIRMNNFSGELDLTQYTSLYQLFLDYCTYDSVILDGLTSLVKFTEFSGAGNRVGSNLSNISCIGCSSLAFVYFDSQDLATIDITGCTSLTIFKLVNTNTIDSGIVGLEELENIKTLWLRSPGITVFPNFSIIALQTFTEIGYEGSGIKDIDLTNCDNLQYFGAVTFNYSKQYLENITLPTVKTNLLKLNVSNAYIEGDIDVTEYSNLVSFEFERNSGLTSVNCSGLTSLSIGESKYLRLLTSMLSLNFANTSFDFLNQSNPMPSLIEIDVTNCNLTKIQLTNSSLPAAQVNKILVEADIAGNSDGTVYIQGDAASPDSSSGGYDGLSAIENLESKGWIITTN